MSDEMYFSSDERALLRGKRRHVRTEVCRPCLVTASETGGEPLEGVILDVTPHGISVRMMDALPTGTQVTVQMMRDDNFRDPLGEPKHGEIVRSETDPGEGFTDHGVRVTNPDIRTVESRPKHIPERAESRPREKPRMHSIDITVGSPPRRRGGT